MGEEENLPHIADDGGPQMVDISDKPEVGRRAVARGEINLTAATIAAIRSNDLQKGDVLAVARVGAVDAVKHTWESIPMCHQIPVTNVETDFTLGDETVTLEVTVATRGQTGCEMEALEGVTTGLNTVWDMVKALEKDADGQYSTTAITNVEVVSKDKHG